MTRKVFIRTEKKYREVLGLKEGEMFDLVGRIYGLCDAGEYWGDKMMTHLNNYLHVHHTNGNSALYYHHDGKTLIGNSGMYLDDLLNAGTQ